METKAERVRTWRIYGVDEFISFMKEYPELVAKRIINAREDQKNLKDRIFWLNNEDGKISNILRPKRITEPVIESVAEPFEPDELYND